MDCSYLRLAMLIVKWVPMVLDFFAVSLNREGTEPVAIPIGGPSTQVLNRKRRRSRCVWLLAKAPGTF